MEVKEIPTSPLNSIKEAKCYRVGKLLSAEQDCLSRA